MRRDPQGWAADMEPRCARFEQAIKAATGSSARITCDPRHDDLVVTLGSPPHPASAGRVADILSPLWPGFLAPAGVCLVLVDGGAWDGEAMALRFHRRRTSE